MLGDIKTTAKLKQASMLRGVELFPAYKERITKHKDADGLLIAYRYAYP